MGRRRSSAAEQLQLDFDGQRVRQERNLFSFAPFDRRKEWQPDGGYRPGTVCPSCGCANTQNGELCRDCQL